MSESRAIVSGPERVVAGLSRGGWAGRLKDHYAELGAAL